MTKKLGDIAIVMVVLLFCIGGITFFFQNTDSRLDVSSSVTTDFNSLDGTLDNVSSLTNSFYDAVDNTTQVQTDPDTEDTEISDATGFINIFSKNILVRFVQGISEKLGIPRIIVSLILGLIGIIITVFMIRAIVGDSRIWFWRINLNSEN